MTHRFAPQAFALTLAAVVTLALLGSIDGLATRQHAGAELAAAQAAAASTAQARSDVAAPRS